MSKILSSFRRQERHCGPLNLLFNGHRGLSRRVRQPGPETDQLPPSSAEVKETCSIHPLSHTSSWLSA
jgi:hypothetical protein